MSGEVILQRSASANAITCRCRAWRTTRSLTRDYGDQDAGQGASRPLVHAFGLFYATNAFAHAKPRPRAFVSLRQLC